MVQDVVIVLVMAIPMLLFGVYPGLVLAEFLQKKYKIEESLKRKVIITTTILFTITLSSILHYL